MQSSFDPTTIDYVAKGLAWAGITSFAGLISLYSAWIVFPPEITIDTVTDKHKKLNSESRIKIKNLGKMPALNIFSTVTELKVVLDSLSMKNCAILNPTKTIPRLASTESSEISISPGIHTQNGAIFSAFEYKLELTYTAKFLFFSRHLKKSWRISLRNLGDEFWWECTIAA
ncbi:hypothetical protein [Methylomagnum ishizawai]|uniref:hypothetical protein n=1 Tax=Methylomagnum ishizawai TaxID=1760988 RepID=UPI001C337EC8|nr:hypothetical protein [Methylomagnum ishizawai]BBL74948.1 hypothetical protein MishRS11D_20460 [Methylomagnum ishizawai]